MKSRFGLALVLMGLVQFASCNGCGPTPLITDLVIVNYTQVGNTDFIAAGQQITDGMFMRYHIDSIANTDTNAKTFHFDPTKIYAGSPSNQPFHHPCITQDAVAVDVPGHTVTSTELFGVTIKVPGDPNSLKTTFYSLTYKSGTGENVLMVASSANIANGNPPQVLPVPYKGDICQGGH